MIFSRNLQVTRKDVLPSARVGFMSDPCPPFSLWRSLRGTSVFVQLVESTSCLVTFIGRRLSLRTWLELCLQGVSNRGFLVGDLNLSHFQCIFLLFSLQDLLRLS